MPSAITPAGVCVARDPARTPTLTYFANDDFFIFAGKNPATCAPLSACSNEQPGFNWSHGDFQQSITRTWLGLVGPHVRQAGATGEVFSDHTDVRPTLLHLTGLRDDYKAINAPVGEPGRKTLELSTRALVSDDATYATLEQQLTSAGSRVPGAAFLILQSLRIHLSHPPESTGAVPPQMAVLAAGGY